MEKIRYFLERWGIHTFLLPIFFTVHTFRQYNGLVSGKVAFNGGMIILLFISFFIILIFALTKNLNRTLQLVTFFAFVFLFFGVIKDSLHSFRYTSFISKYSVLLPILFIAIALLTRTILKKENFLKINLFQNALLSILLLIDLTQLVALNSSTFLHRNLLVKGNDYSIQPFFGEHIRPDVYYLVFDSYPGTTFLKKYMNFDNSAFTRELEKRRFCVVKDPKSNYNRTTFSIASTLNFQYLKDFAPSHVGPKDYARANLTIRQAIVPQFFLKEKYSFYNLSIFDIDTVPSIRRETFLTMPEQSVFLYNTLSERIKNDILWNLVTGKYAISAIKRSFAEQAHLSKMLQAEKKTYNRTIVDSVVKVANENRTPKFVYAHFYLPHAPFFYDEYGKENDPAYIVSEASLKNKDMFLSYVKYTNKKIQGIVDSIKVASGNTSVIIIQSDHGYRDYTENRESYFANFSAFYFPDNDYSSLHDTLSNINTFPLIFNKYFHTNIPLQKDSSIFLSN
jgi:hypothetical protein